MQFSLKLSTITCRQTVVLIKSISIHVFVRCTSHYHNVMHSAGISHKMCCLSNMLNCSFLVCLCYYRSIFFARKSKLRMYFGDKIMVTSVFQSGQYKLQGRIQVWADLVLPPHPPLTAKSQKSSLFGGYINQFPPKFWHSAPSFCKSWIQPWSCIHTWSNKQFYWINPKMS